MTVKTAYAPGEPIWADLSSADVRESGAFYGALLGWTAGEGQPEFGGYASFELDGHKVAGLMPLMQEGQQPSWTCYFASDDAAKTTALVEQGGGTVIAPPMAVGDLGTMAVFLDPAGAFFGIWQAGQHTGSELVDVEGSLKWVELTAADPAGAAPFYADVFGWGVSATDAYVELTLDGEPVAGVADASQGTSGWVPYFVVGDPGAKADQAVELGGSVVLPLTGFPGGSCAIVRDPQGATFGLLSASA